MMNKFSISQKGQSLIEIIIVMAMCIVILPALLTGLVSSRQGKVQQAQKTQAIYLLNETVDAIRSVREKGWVPFAIDGTYHTATISGSWSLATGSAVINGFTQQVVISDVNRDSNGAIILSGGKLDPSSKKVDVLVSWEQPYLSTVSANLYMTRYLDNNSFTHTTVADFNAGILGGNTQVKTTAGLDGEVTLANNNKAKWCSPEFSLDNGGNPVTIDLPDGPPVAVVATASASQSIPNDVFVATAPYATSSVKLVYVTVNADVGTLSMNDVKQKGIFTLDSGQYSNSSYLPSGINLTNSFKTNDIKYYRSPSGRLYGLLATDLPDHEIIAIEINDGTSDTYQDPVSKIYKYWTFFNTSIYSVGSGLDTGFLNPSANTAETSSAGDNNGFGTNPTSAYSDNSSFAVDTDSGSGTGTDCLGADKDKHRFYNYNFSLPTATTVEGIEVRLDAKADSVTGGPKMCVQLSWDGGSTWTSPKSTNTLTTSEATYVLGGASDTWSRTWDNSNFTNANFRVRVINVASNISRDFSLDWVGVKVHYGGGYNTNDQSPYGYGGSSFTVLGNTGYVASGGYLYAFNLSNIDSKSPTNELDQIGCRIQLDAYDCKNGYYRKYGAGDTGTNWDSETEHSRSGDGWGPVIPSCKNGGNIENFATNDMYPVKVGSNTYIFVAVGFGVAPELDIVNATTPPANISSSSCGITSSASPNWRKISSLDFNNDDGDSCGGHSCPTEEASNSVFVKSDGTRAYMSSNGGIDANQDGQPDSKQFYIINTTNKSSPAFLSGTGAPTSGFYYGANPNDDLFPRRSLTVLNGERAVIVGVDGFPGNGKNPKDYQVLKIDNEATPTYCAGLDFDQGFNDLTSVSEADGDNFVYMVTNTMEKQLRIIQGGPDTGIYVSGGAFESSVFPAPFSSSFYRFTASVSQPAQTTIKAQVGLGSLDVNGVCTNSALSYVGPNGDPGAYFTATAGIISGTIPFGTYGDYQNPNSCFKYKFFLDTTDYNSTPTLYDINVNYSP